MNDPLAALKARAAALGRPLSASEGLDMLAGGAGPAMCDAMGASRRDDLAAAAREIDVLIAAGDVAAMERWLDANADRRVRARDTIRLAKAIRAAEKGAPT